VSAVAGGDRALAVVGVGRACVALLTLCVTIVP
jgi:hypothetical protein